MPNGHTQKVLFVSESKTGDNTHTMKKNFMMKVAGLTLLGIGMSSICLASGTPEIDPASGGSALAMLAGVMLMVRGRRRR